MLPALKRRKGCPQLPDQNKDEQAISESSLNKLVGAADTYDLKVQVIGMLVLIFVFKLYATGEMILQLH